MHLKVAGIPAQFLGFLGEWPAWCFYPVEEQEKEEEEDKFLVYRKINVLKLR